MLKLINQFLRLPSWERLMFFRLYLLLPLIGTSVRFQGFGRTKALLERLVGSDVLTQPHSNPTEFAERIAYLVSVAGCVGPYRATCLRLSLALWWILARRGIGSDICFGIRQDESGVKAHAWVELKGDQLKHKLGSSANHSPLAALQAVSSKANS